MTKVIKDLQIIHQMLSVRKHANNNLHDMATSLFQPGLKVRYLVNDRHYFGKVVFVCGIPGTTRVRVKNLYTLKERVVELFQITDLVQEQ